MPRLKGVSFETAIIERYRRRESSVEEALIEMYLAAECIYLCCQYSDAILAVQQLDTLGNTIPIVSCSTIMKQEFLDAVGDLANGIYLENAFNLKSENPEYLELAEYCREKNGTEPDVYVTQAYDSLKVMLEAVEKFGPDRAAIKDYIYTLKDWQGVSAAAWHSFYRGCAWIPYFCHMRQRTKICRWKFLRLRRHRNAGLHLFLKIGI